MNNCFLVHGHSFKGGYNSGEKTVDKLGPYVEKLGWNPVNWDYKVGIFRGSWHPFYWYILGKRLANAAQNGDIAIGSSAGASAIYMAIEHYNAPFSQVILISPVLRKDAAFPKNGCLKDIYVWHAPGDNIVKGASMARYMPLSPWGGMGLDGYAGPEDKRVKNINKENDFKEQGKSAPGHCDVFSAEKLPFWAPLMLSGVVNLHAAIPKNTSSDK